MQRLGVIIPSSNTTTEPEFFSALYDATVSLHFARIPLNNVTVKELSAMEKETEAAANLLKDADVDAVAFACTSGSLIKGIGHDAAIAGKITKVAKCPAVVTSSAVVNALKKLYAYRIALVTPYIEEVNKREVDFLSNSGFEIISVQAMGVEKNLKIGRLTANDAAALAQKTDCNSADAVFISCTNFATFSAIPRLEAQLKKPVVSSNSATLWAALEALQVKIPVPLGRLFGV